MNKLPSIIKLASYMYERHIDDIAIKNIKSVNPNEVLRVKYYADTLAFYISGRTSSAEVIYVEFLNTLAYLNPDIVIRVRTSETKLYVKSDLPESLLKKYNRIVEKACKYIEDTIDQKVDNAISDLVEGLII